MKLKLVLKGKKKLLYCPNGSILKADKEVLIRLLNEFGNPSSFQGEDGAWNTLTSDLSKTTGTILAAVDESFRLVIYSPIAFSEVIGAEEFISASEYAELHGKSHPLIKRLCMEGRIEGAQKNRSGWIIPKNAPYPERKKREVKKITED